jgi:hypothetical protein
MTAVRLAAVLGSLAALAILISPVSPLLLGQSTPAPTPGIIGEEPIDEAKIAPAEVAPEDFAECNSLNDGIQKIVAGDGKNETYKIAADLLLGEYCNRPDLVHEISASGDPGVSLVAYACEAALLKHGDSAMQDSMADHTAIYCESSRTSIETGIESLSTAVQGFREDFLPELESANTETGTAVYDLESIRAELDRITMLANHSSSLLGSGEHYDASQTLDEATAAFNSLLESIETE